MSERIGTVLLQHFARRDPGKARAGLLAWAAELRQRALDPSVNPWQTLKWASDGLLDAVMSKPEDAPQ